MPHIYVIISKLFNTNQRIFFYTVTAYLWKQISGAHRRSKMQSTNCWGTAVFGMAKMNAVALSRITRRKTEGGKKEERKKIKHGNYNVAQVQTVSMLKLVKGKQPLPYCYYDGKKAWTGCYPPWHGLCRNTLRLVSGSKKPMVTCTKMLLCIATVQSCHLLKPNWKTSSSHSISTLTNISTQFLLHCVCVCVCVRTCVRTRACVCLFPYNTLCKLIW